MAAAENKRARTVKAIKVGATDFVLKPWENEKLLATIYSAMRLHETKVEVANLRSRQQLLSADADNKFHDIIGNSLAMQHVYKTIERVAITDANVLILGENGTGKEVIARSIHRNSLRAEEPFIGVDMGAISESLFESELFGHMKGSFTDAKEDRPGRFEVAHKGTLFLDEIANLSLPLQAKLLSVLQSRQVTRVGSNKAKDVDIRLISATNMPILDMVKDNKFRQDLLYRINTIEIQIPALRDRREDIPLLANHFLNVYDRKYQKNVRAISESAMKILQKYNWPGNVRELQHALERAVIMSNSQVLNPEDFFFSSNASRNEESNVTLDDYHLEEVEKILIRKVLTKHDGNITQAASELGLTRSSLYRRLEKYGL